MSTVYERDLDLNLLRVFVVVAESGSVTAAAARLYLTQPAVSAALKRLEGAVGARLFARQGRGLVLTARGERLHGEAKPHLAALVAAALSPPGFDPASSERTVRLGLSDSAEASMLPPLLRALEAEAPRMRVVVHAVQFRTVADALASGRVELAITVADELPAGTHREPLFHGGFSALFDPRHARLGPRPSLGRYLAHDHVIVSYNGDLRGVVEDALGVTRRVRCSVPSFHALGAILEGSALVATVPDFVARDIRRTRPALRVARLPFTFPRTAVELLIRGAVADDPAMRFLRAHLVRIARDLTRTPRRGP